MHKYNLRKYLYGATAVLLLTGYVSGADLFEPVDVTSTSNNPYVTFGAFTPGDGVLNGAAFIANYGDTVNEDGNATLLQKNRTANSFTESTLFYGTEVFAGTKTVEVPWSSKKINEFSLTKGGSNTFTCDGIEHTVSLEYVESTSNPQDVQYVFDGTNKTRTEGEIDDFDCDGSGSDTSPHSPDFLRIESATSGTDIADFQVIRSPDLSTGYYELRPRYDQNDGGTTDTSSEVIQFSVGKNGNNQPRPSWNYGICVEDSSCIKPGQSLSSVTPNSSITFKIREPDGDNVPRTLLSVEAQNSNVEIDQNTLDLLLNAFGLLQPTDGTKITFDPNPCAGRLLSCSDDEDFLSQTGTTYKFHIYLQDTYETSGIGDVTGGRESLTVTLSTDTSGNNIDSISTNSLECEVNSQWKACDQYIYNSTFNVSRMRANVTYSNADVLAVKFSIADEYDYPSDFKFHMKNYTSKSGDYFIYDIPEGQEFKFNDSGEWNASVRAVTTTGVTDWKNQTWNLSWGTPVVENLTVNGATSGPVDVKKYRQMNVSADITCTGGECASETNGTHPVAENVTVWLDPAAAGTEPRKVSVSGFSSGRRKVVMEIYRNEDTVLKQFARWVGQWI